MKYKHIIFIISILCSYESHASSECDVASDHVTERACLTKEAKKIATDVKSMQGSIISAIGAWDEDQSFKETSLKYFNSAISNFEKFRDTQCEYEASVAAGGNGAGDMRLNCEIELNRFYLKELILQKNWFSKTKG